MDAVSGLAETGAFKVERTRKIIRTSVIGVGINIVLVVFKLFVGILSNSIAIILDAVNNLSDALSSVITIIGTKLAQKAPDKKHPFGYGRSEYISSVVISVIVLLAGFSALKESVGKIISPEDAQYSTVTLVVIVAAIVVKLVFGQYLRKIGKEINAQSLEASGADSVMDAIVSLGTLVSAAVSLLLQINIDGILGALISLVILKTGIELLKETLDRIIGARIDSRITTEIKKRICTHREVLGAYDLVLHDYGPNELMGSVHIEVRDDITAKELDAVSRQIVSDIYVSFGVLLTIGIYAANMLDDRFAEMKNTILREAGKHGEILQVHGFYVDEAQKRVTFDLVMDYTAPNPAELVNELHDKLASIYNEYEFSIVRDRDFSD